MLTGDNAGVARAIADQIGIEEVIAGVLPEEKPMKSINYNQLGKWPLLVMVSMTLLPSV